MHETDVVVVGAGLAGLRCTAALRARGHDVVLLEQADAVGGRVRSDVVDGFVLDRGFQLLNPAYPAVRRWVDVERLGLQSFAAGVAARDERTLHRLGVPWREPGLLGPTVRALAPRARELAAAARWATPLGRARPGRSLARALSGPGDHDLARGEAADRAGLDGLLRSTLDSFFAGVVLEDEGSTSHAYALLLVATFLRGVPGLPARGMQALPDLLAVGLDDALRLATPVERVEPRAGRVDVHAGGEVLRARQVVVATAAQDCAALAGPAASADGGLPATKGVVTSWYATDEPPTTSALLHVDGRTRPAGPVVNTAVVSNAAPSYAPAGRHLVQASALLRPGSAAVGDDEVRRHAADLLGADAGGWRLLRRDEVPHALPAQVAPLRLRRELRVGEGVVVCGDHRDTASIQGALVSGQRAATEVAAVLDRPRAAG